MDQQPRKFVTRITDQDGARRKTVKAYMGYSRSAGAHEGASLIFAHTAKEARKLAWQSVVGREIAENYLDVAVYWLKNEPWLFKEMPTDDTPCFVNDPKTCSRCEMWGNGEIGDDGVCSACKEIAPSSNNCFNLTQ